MANPFFIPAGPSVGERVAQPLTELMRIRQVGELGREHNRLMGEDVALRKEGLDLQRQNLLETQRERKAKIPVSRQNFDANAAKVLGMAVDRMDPKGALKWLKQDWEMMAENPEVDKGYVYGYYLNNWPAYKEKIVQSFRELATNVATDEKLTPYQKEQFKKQYEGMAEQVSKDKEGKTLAMFFPTVAKEWETEKQPKQENTPDKIQLVNDFIQRFGRNPTEQEVSQLYGMAKPQVKPEQYAPDMQIFINEKNESIPVDIRNPISVQLAQSAGFQPITPEMRGYGTEIGKKNATAEDQINKDSKAARNQIATLKAVDELLDRFTSGKLTKIGMTLQQYANALGMPVNVTDLADKEAFNAMLEQFALQSRNQGEGMVLAGQMSDRDVQFLRDMNPQLILSKGGNKLLIRMRIAMANRQSETANLMREYKQQNKGRFDASGFDSYVQEKLGNKSIFDIPEGSRLVGTDGKTGLPAYETPDGKFIIPSF